MYSKCSACNGTSFEMVETNVARCRFRLHFVQCASCGTAVGVMEYNNLGAMIEQLEKRIERLESRVR